MKTNKGFTLIELLVVVLIIGILAAIALPMYTKAVEKTRAVSAVVWTKTAGDSLQRYMMENPDGDYFDYRIEADGSTSGSADALDITPAISVKGYEFCELRFLMEEDPPRASAVCQHSSGLYEIWYDVYPDGFSQAYCSPNEDDGRAKCRAFGYTQEEDIDMPARMCTGTGDFGINDGCMLKP